MTITLMIVGGAMIAFSFGFFIGYHVGKDDGFRDAMDWYNRKRKAGL